jgi:hemoglobin
VARGTFATTVFIVEMTVYEAAGGTPFFAALVDAFYRCVAADPVLLRLYPDQVDLAPAAERLTLFLVQYWGGPTTYSDARGHPRLRMRHNPYVVGVRERDHWLAAMTVALDELAPAPELRERFDAYFAMAADSMINQPG